MPKSRHFLAASGRSLPVMPKDPRTRPTGDRLRAGSVHLLYEIEMFCALADFFETGEADQAVAGLPHQGLAVRNAMIESWAVHFRALTDFLWPPPLNAKADDVFAEDYIEGWAFDKNAWDLERRRVHKHVAT